MNTIKPSRGRPPGSGKKDDATLMEVARLMVRDPSLKRTTAMKRVIAARKDWPEQDGALLRRLQVKWRTVGQSFLDRAQGELARRSPSLPEILDRVQSGLFNFERFMLSPEVLQTLSKWESGLNSFFNSPVAIKALEGVAAWERKWKEAVALSPLLDINKLDALKQQSLWFDTDRLAALQDKFSGSTWSPELQNRLGSLDETTRRYLATGFLSSPPSKG